MRYKMVKGQVIVSSGELRQCPDCHTQAVDVNPRRCPECGSRKPWIPVAYPQEKGIL